MTPHHRALRPAGAGLLLALQLVLTGCASDPPLSAGSPQPQPPTDETVVAPETQAVKRTKPLHLESERFSTRASKGDVVQSWRHKGPTGGLASRFLGNEVGDFVTYTVPSPGPGSYRLRLGTRTFDQRGIYELAVNGVPHGDPIDTYAADPSHPKLDLGTIRFTDPKPAEFTFTAIGKNPSSKGYTFELDYVEFVPTA